MNKYGFVFEILSVGFYVVVFLFFGFKEWIKFNGKYNIYMWRGN